MTPIAVIALDGVLVDEATTAPIPTGRRLYDTLSASYRVFLVLDAPLDPLWLQIAGFTSHKVVIENFPELGEDKTARRIRQMERIRGMGGTVDLLIDSDPFVAAEVAKMGIVCLHYVDAPYARPEFHPSYKDVVTPWEMMVEEIDKTKVIRAADNRMTEDD